MANSPVNLLALPVLAAIGCLLAGCFESQQPKFSLAGAAKPLGDGGRYVVYEHVAGDRFKRQEVFEIKRRPDGAYDFVNEEGKRLVISLHAVGGERFAGQASAQKDGHPPAYGYVMFRVAGNEALLYAPQCDQQDKAVLDAFGVVLRDRYNCIIDGVADPVGLFKQLRLGDPISKLVRE